MLPCGQTPLSRGDFKALGQCLPIGQALGKGQSGCLEVAGEVEQLGGGNLLAQKVDPNVIELMSLVKDGDPNVGQKFGHAGLPHRHVGEKQMMIDHHNVCRQSLLACQVDMARLELWTLRTQTVFPCGCDLR